MSTNAQSETSSAPEFYIHAAAFRMAMLFCGLVMLAVLPFFVYPIFVMKVLCFALFAAAFNLLLGYTGLLSFGHAIFFGGGAYLTAHAAKAWALSPELSLLFSVCGAGVLGLGVGAIAIRRQGIYFAMITLALAQMFYFFCLQVPFTHGEDGIQSVPRGALLGVFDLAHTANMYVFVLIVFLSCLLIIHRFVNSPFGMVLKAIRDNESRAVSLGFEVNRYKLVAFVMSAALSGLAGGMKALVFQFATLSDVGWHTSGEAILITLLGGIGTMAGPIVGAAIEVGLQDYLATSDFPVTVATGLIFMVCVMVFRKGVVGEFTTSKLGRKLGFKFETA